MGIKLGYGMDGLMIDALVNGEQTDGSESAPVIGTTTGVMATFAYKDLLGV